MTFTEAQQAEHRDAFIRECRQKAWGAACHVEWIGKQMDDLMAQYTKLSDDNVALAMEIQTLETALDSHTKDNRENRKTLQARRTDLEKTMDGISRSANEGQKAMQQLYASVESAMALAAHAEGWNWKEHAPSL